MKTLKVSGPCPVCGTINRIEKEFSYFGFSQGYSYLKNVSCANCGKGYLIKTPASQMLTGCLAI